MGTGVHAAALSPMHTWVRFARWFRPGNAQEVANGFWRLHSRCCMHRATPAMSDEEEVFSEEEEEEEEVDEVEEDDEPKAKTKRYISRFHLDRFLLIPHLHFSLP